VQYGVRTPWIACRVNHKRLVADGFAILAAVLAHVERSAVAFDQDKFCERSLARH
jgi:hypothetical protein